jgi:hypothetical protein
VLKLLDFGVAMALADVATEQKEKRQKGFAVFGTPEYMAPEQVAGEAVDGRCDIYALGCVLYELLTGTKVFEGTSSVVVMGKQLRETPESLRVRAPHRGIPVELDALVLRTLKKAPTERFESATLLREALEAALVAPAKRREQARRRITSGAVALGLLGVVGLVASPTMPKFTSRAPTPVAITQPQPLPSVETPVQSPAAPATGVAASAPVPAPEAALAANDAPKQEARSSHEIARAEREHALHEAREAAKDTPGDVKILKQWAIAAYKAGALREARRAADAWILIESTPEPHILLAEILDAMGHRGEAKSVLAEVLEAHPDSTAARRLAARYGAPVSAPETTAQKSQVARR